MPEQAGATTALMRQYLDVKARYPDAIVFFRLGDFYEMFYEDAKAASKVLGNGAVGHVASGHGTSAGCGGSGERGRGAEGSRGLWEESGAAAKTRPMNAIAATSAASRVAARRACDSIAS